MNPKYRILIPIALAVLAAAANFVMLKRATATTAVIVLARDVPAGKPIEPADLKLTQVRADDDVFLSAYPAKEIKSLTDSTFRRDMKAGNLVITFDIAEDGQTWKLRPDERDSFLILPTMMLPEGLAANEMIEFVVAGSDMTFGPYRLLGTKLLPVKHAQEPLSRVSFAGTDLKAVLELKANNPDAIRLAKSIQMQRVGAGSKATPVGTKVAARPQPNGQ